MYRGCDMVASIAGGGINAHQTLFDFTRIVLENGSSPALLWTENSDSTRSSSSSTGMSKASLVVHKSQSFQRAVLFTLLNPRKTGTGYAAVQCSTNFNLADFNNISLRCRAQGVNAHYKMILRHKGDENNSPVYGQVFAAPIDEFATVKLPLATFKPYHRGRELPLEENPLDRTAITNIGLKIDYGHYLPDNQAGVAALEIDWIKATK